MRFRLSRWRFWYLYMLLFFLVMFTLYLNDRALDVWAWTVGVVSFAFLAFLELLIRSEQIIIDDRGVTLQQGFVTRHSVPVTVHHVSVVQHALGRLLQFGDVTIHLRSQNHTIVGLDEPVRAANELRSPNRSSVI